MAHTSKLTLILMMMIAFVPAASQLPASRWRIQSNSTTDWQGYGLIQQSGSCSWSLRDSSHNIELKLFEDPSYRRFLRVTIFLNYSINRAYPAYRGTAHASYQLHQGETLRKEVKDFEIMPDVELFNGSLMVSQGNGTLWVQLGEDKASAWLLTVTILHLGVKMGLLFGMVQGYRAVANKISLSLVYVVVGWELQAHSTVISLFQAAQDEVSGMGMFLGFMGWGLTLLVLFVLPQPFFPWETFEGLVYYAYAISSAGLFSQSTNILLYALTPLLQVRFNIMRKEKHSVCWYFYALYLVNIFFLYYIKGCPASLLRYPIDLTICFTATFIAALLGAILYLQGKYGPLLCLRELILGKDFRYMLQISLSEGEQMMQEVCAICLQPLATQALVQNFRESGEGRRGTIMRTPCNHKYHGECLRTWLQEKNTCPLDNLPIPPCFE